MGGERRERRKAEEKELAYNKREPTLANIQNKVQCKVIVYCVI